MFSILSFPIPHPRPQDGWFPRITMVTSHDATTCVRTRCRYRLTGRECGRRKSRDTERDREPEGQRRSETEHEPLTNYYSAPNTTLARTNARPRCRSPPSGRPFYLVSPWLLLSSLTNRTRARPSFRGGSSQDPSLLLRWRVCDLHDNILFPAAEPACYCYYCYYYCCCYCYCYS